MSTAFVEARPRSVKNSRFCGVNLSFSRIALRFYHVPWPACCEKPA